MEIAADVVATSSDHQPHEHDGDHQYYSNSKLLIRKGSASSSSFRLRCPSLNSLRLRRIFDLFDKNNDGIITVHELTQALNLLGLDAHPSEIDLMLHSYIKPDSIGLKFDDFESLHRSINDAIFGLNNDQEDDDHASTRRTLAEAASDRDQEESDHPDRRDDDLKAAQEESDLTEAFKVFDEDGDGYISARELQTVLSKLGLPEGREMDRVEQMILSVDTNHDGLVDFFEFKDMMRSVIIPAAAHTSA